MTNACKVFKSLQGFKFADVLLGFSSNLEESEITSVTPQLITINSPNAAILIILNVFFITEINITAAAWAENKSENKNK